MNDELLLSDAGEKRGCESLKVQLSWSDVRVIRLGGVDGANSSHSSSAGEGNESDW